MVRPQHQSPRNSSSLVFPVALFLVLPAFASRSTLSQREQASEPSGPVARFLFDGDVRSTAGTDLTGTMSGSVAFLGGLDGQALHLAPDHPAAHLTIAGPGLTCQAGHDLSVQFWVRSTADPGRRMVLLSQKEFTDNSLESQKRPGWVFYTSNGTWAWNMGSGKRRITYERDNGERMPVNDGEWHQLTMTYHGARSEVRLFHDGHNKAVYHVSDSVGFDFSTTSPLVVGWTGEETNPRVEIVPVIPAGAEQLQALVDTFNDLGVDEVESDEFVHLIVDPRRLFDRKAEQKAEEMGEEGAAFLEAMRSVDFGPISKIEAELMRNPYTVHQALSFMEAAPLLKIYSLVDGAVTVNEDVARTFSETERLYPPDFGIDRLEVWDRALSSEEVLASYSTHREPETTAPGGKVTSITAAVWNIFHGGKHFTTEEHGWDSRVAIAEILKRENVDVVMMQETYSSGDFIAAELGYYFATTVDWDYLNQGSNISVLSRYPIEELHVPEDSTFMNIAAKVAINDEQAMYVMSNWYGMQQFPAVFDFHESRFAESDTTPILFAGDFNAVPHTDGGKSPASRTLLDAGFTDAFRELHPGVEGSPGHTHRSGSRIDQLYYRGLGLRNTSTRIVSEVSGDFPSDHYLILATFELADPATR